MAEASSGGQVGTVHNFSPNIGLTSGTPITVYRLPAGAVVYEAEPIATTTPYHAASFDELFAEFRRRFGRSPDPAPGGSRDGSGYVRAPFAPRCEQPDPAPSRLEEPEPVADPDPLVAAEFVAYTRWAIRWGYLDGAIRPHGSDDFAFDPTRLYANLAIATRLAEWEEATSDSANPIDRRRWDNFGCELDAHEQLHRETGRAVARNVLDAAAKLRGATRAELIAKYSCVWEQGFAWGNAEDLRIDEYTGHGPAIDAS